jgi:hypothetical protein
VPLVSLSATTRGKVLEGVTRYVLITIFGASITAAPAGERVNGTARSSHQTACDFVANGKLAEHKASMMSWSKHERQWRLQFQKIKSAEHELLYLAWMSPRGIHIFLHDGVAGLAGAGASESADGKNIVFCAPWKVFVWQSAEKHLLKLMGGFHKLPYIAFVEFADGDAESALAYGATQSAWLGGGEEEEESEEDAVIDDAGEEEEESEGEEESAEEMEM